MPISKSGTNIQKIKIGITMGDPAGIGPEIIARIATRGVISRLGEVLVIGDRWVFDKIKYQKSNIKDPQFINLKNVPHRNFKFGRIKAEYGKASLD